MLQKNDVGGDMIGDREQVYENIKTAVSLNQLNSKVEPGDQIGRASCRERV